MTAKDLLEITSVVAVVYYFIFSYQSIFKSILSTFVVSVFWALVTVGFYSSAAYVFYYEGNPRGSIGLVEKIFYGVVIIICFFVSLLVFLRIMMPWMEGSDKSGSDK